MNDCFGNFTRKQIEIMIGNNANNLVYNLLPQNISYLANYQSIKMFGNSLKEKHMQIIVSKKCFAVSK